MKARTLLTVSALLAWAFAAALLFAARAFEARVGIVLDDKLATIVQAQGAILAGLRVVNWLSRRAEEARALVPVFAGNLVVQVLSLAVAGRAVALGLFPPSGAGALVIHVVLGAWFAIALVRVRRESGAGGAAGTR